MSISATTNRNPATAMIPTNSSSSTTTNESKYSNCNPIPAAKQDHDTIWNNTKP